MSALSIPVPNSTRSLNQSNQTGEAKGAQVGKEEVKIALVEII